MWAALIAVILPWQIWTRLVQQIASDLLSQNFGHADSAWGFVYPRLFNLATLMLPLFLLPKSWASIDLRGNLPVSLVFAVGVILLLFLPWALVRTARELPLLAIWLCLESGMLVITAFGEFGARPLLHGWQPVAPVFLALTLLALWRRFGPHAVLLAACVQLPLNIAILVTHGLAVYRGV